MTERISPLKRTDNATSYGSDIRVKRFHFFPRQNLHTGITTSINSGIMENTAYRELSILKVWKAPWRPIHLIASGGRRRGPKGAEEGRKKAEGARRPLLTCMLECNQGVPWVRRSVDSICKPKWSSGGRRHGRGSDAAGAARAKVGCTSHVISLRVWCILLGTSIGALSTKVIITRLRKSFRHAPMSRRHGFGSHYACTVRVSLPEFNEFFTQLLVGLSGSRSVRYRYDSFKIGLGKV